MDDDFTAWAAGAEQALLRSAYLLTGDLHRAEDLVQEALVKVALRWRRLRAGHPTAYARRIIANDHISLWRRHGREVPVAALHDGASAVSSDPEAVLVVQKALARLTPSQRAVVVLRHFDDLSEQETAEALGVSVGTVKSQNAAALTRLRTGAPELLDLVVPTGLGERAAREAGRRTQRRVLGGTAVAVVLVLLAGVLVLRGGGDAEPPPIAPTTAPTSAPTSAPTDPASAAPGVEQWDPFTVPRAPVRASMLPRRLDPPPAGTVPNVRDEPLPGGAVLAWPERGADLRLLGADGTWRCVKGTGDLLADTLGGTVVPALSDDGTQVAFATYDGIRVVDVTAGGAVGDRTVPWPQPLAERWDNPPALTWLPDGEGWFVAHWTGGWLVRPDGSGTRAPYGTAGGTSVRVARDGTVVTQQEAFQGFDLWRGDRRVRSLPSNYWATGIVSGFGRIAFVGAGTRLPAGTTGLVALDDTTGDLVAAAMVPDPSSVYGDNGYLRTVGLLDADTLLALVGPMRFGEMEIGDETWHLVAWHPSTGAFERLTSGPPSMRGVSVAVGPLAGP
ncbi:SigE family RNA polymerase sigma factor [Pimelobacter simplex]|uniref:SigE family RNA polymerase sigma factor n=1 Tax=Nocardioides simplex TaxID=2045 RepID=UPI00116D3DC8|nr:SigE family RNA polymerase sigma factor [Pimelobacter simplex]GEB17002.1 hypothetical protein NSI01_53170 [Pimelobacter simplex]